MLFRSHCINRRASGVQDVTVISTEELFADPYMAHLAKGHHDLYLVEEENVQRAELRSKPSRETWLIFKLDRLMVPTETPARAATRVVVRPW